ncbi:MAG: tetratricopeptide repeat protein [Puniceicoccales bacterium]
MLEAFYWKWRQDFRRGLCWLVLPLMAASLWGQTAVSVPLLTEETPQVVSPATAHLIATGDDALRAGLPTLAERFYLRALSDNSLREALRLELNYKLAVALISQRKLVAARRLLDALPDSDDPREDLSRALLAYYGGDQASVKADLDKINPNELPPEFVPWYYLLQGLWERSQGTLVEAESYFKQALAKAVTATQRADFEAEIFRSQIIAGEADEETAKLLQKKVEENRGARVGFGFARQYAIVLDLLGRKTQAIEVLQDQLKLLTEQEKPEQTEILLLIALISGENSQRGQLALEEILRTAADKEASAIALSLLSRSDLAETNPAEFKQLLDELLTQPNHPLNDELLLLRARFMLRKANPDPDLAVRDAEALIERYPGSPLRIDAIRLLAFQAWNAEPPRYRMAADYLNQIREALPPGREHRYYGRLVADSFFLNGDYQAAAEVYEAVLNEEPDTTERGELLLQLVESLIREKHYDEAGEVLDQSFAAASASTERRWEAEWSLASSMTRSGEAEAALERLRRILSLPQSGTMPAALRLRLLWLEIKLASDLNQYEFIPAMTDTLLADVGATPDDQVPIADRELIAANALFLRGRALLRLGRNDQAFATFASLREKFPTSDAAVLSYLEEARYLVAQGIFNEAQLSYRKIADDYPSSPQAAIALYEGAMAAEAQGQPRNLTEALKYLEELAVEYPNHDLVFSARIRQGDILRKLDEFSLAQQTYENLIQQFSGRRSDVYLAELYRANTLMAQAGGDPQRLIAVAADLENLFDRPDAPLDFRLEAGFAWAHCLRQAGNNNLAQDALWQVVTLAAPDGEVDESLTPTGRIWLSKSLLRLADMLAAEGKPRESARVLEIIVRNQLPGWHLARSRLGREVSTN